jgi:hypothetical protein
MSSNNNDNNDDDVVNEKALMQLMMNSSGLSGGNDSATSWEQQDTDTSRVQHDRRRASSGLEQRASNNTTRQSNHNHRRRASTSETNHPSSSSSSNRSNPRVYRPSRPGAVAVQPNANGKGNTFVKRIRSEARAAAEARAASSPLLELEQQVVACIEHEDRPASTAPAYDESLDQSLVLQDLQETELLVQEKAEAMAGGGSSTSRPGAVAVSGMASANTSTSKMLPSAEDSTPNALEQELMNTESLVHEKQGLRNGANYQQGTKSATAKDNELQGSVDSMRNAVVQELINTQSLHKEKQQILRNGGAAHYHHPADEEEEESNETATSVRRQLIETELLVSEKMGLNSGSNSNHPFVIAAHSSAGPIFIGDRSFQSEDIDDEELRAQDDAFLMEKVLQERSRAATQETTRRNTGQQQRQQQQRQQPPRRDSQRPGAYLQAPGTEPERLETPDLNDLRSSITNMDVSMNSTGTTFPTADPSKWGRPNTAAHEEQGAFSATRRETSNDDNFENGPIQSNGQYMTTTMATAGPLDEELAVAQPIPEEEDPETPRNIPLVEEHDVEQKQAEAKRRKQQLKRRIMVLVSCCTCIVIVGATLLGIFLNQKDDTEVIVQTAPPTFAWESYIMSLLPKKTLQTLTTGTSLENLLDSPQRKALTWIVQDPHLADYDEWRILQRFAMATLFYSTKGDIDRGWAHDDHWLSYNKSECLWYNRNLGDSGYGGSCFQGVLERLDLSGNELVGTLPYELSLLTNLIELQFTGNFTDPLDEDSVKKNFISGTIPSILGTALTSLNALQLSGNQLSGTIPTELGLLKDVSFLYLDDNKLTGSLPTEVGLLTSVIGLRVANNKLTGTIPWQELCSGETTLQWLHAYDNQLNGTIATKIGLCTSLQQLELQNNTLLTGSLPTELGLATSLRDFRFSNNWITGPIPTELGLIDLGYFEAANNQLTGTLPETLAFWHEGYNPVYRFDIANNDLTGTIPPSLGPLATTSTSEDYKIEVFNVSGNSFSGQIPKGWCTIDPMVFDFDCATSSTTNSSSSLCGCSCACN